MRKLTSHQINPCNDQLTIEVLDEPGSGGANHLYRISGYVPQNNPSVAIVGGQGLFHSTVIMFQNGPIKEVGVNGNTHECLLAVLEDRLVGFQAGPYACEENAQALFHIQEAQRYLNSRTKTRVDRGVEGTHEV